MLETEMKKLTAAIEDLTATLKAQGDKKPNSETLKALEDSRSGKVERVETIEEVSGYTTDDIKSMALGISRKDRSKQKDIKAKLAEHDAKIATDLTGDALQAVGEWLSALKEELGE